VIVGTLYILSDKALKDDQIVSNEFVEKYNPKGQKLQITFTDGTKVKLNSDTKISYKKHFDPEKREVYLEGEAFFEVTKDSNRPFIVNTGNLSTRVLGTSFNIRAYPEEQNIQVAVSTGLVAVEDHSIVAQNPDNTSIILSPDEMADYNIAQKYSKVRTIDIDKITSWSNGVLVFDDPTFDEVVYTLERWYGVEFKFERSKPVLKGYRVEHKNESLPKVLEGISFASRFEYEIVGNTVIIR
jgi:ferric-dicitrate binding protein FerR (iron transport regulator)